jgi:hypothetical protein
MSVEGELAPNRIALDRADIAARRARLEAARVTLKEHFVGIDGIIDELCDAVTVWFVAPELLSRPAIINPVGDDRCRQDRSSAATSASTPLTTKAIRSRARSSVTFGSC